MADQVRPMVVTAGHVPGRLTATAAGRALALGQGQGQGQGQEQEQEQELPRHPSMAAAPVGLCLLECWAYWMRSLCHRSCTNWQLRSPIA